MVSLISSAVSKSAPPESRAQLGVPFPNFVNARRGSTAVTQLAGSPWCQVAMHAEHCEYFCRNALGVLRSFLPSIPL